MNYFYYIHKNIYETYFKKYTNLRNWFEYFNTLYYLGHDKCSVFESTEYNKYKSADKWLKNGKIDETFFIFENENFLLRNDLFFLISDKMHHYFENIDSIEEFKSLLHKMISEPESLEYPFSFQDGTKTKLNLLFISYDISDFFSVLLLFAQTGRMITPYSAKAKKKIVEVYDKTTITEHFAELVEDAIELDMMQISVPSLIEKYTDFYKPDIYNILIQLLNNGCNINFIFSDYIYELQIQNYVYCCKNNFSLFGNVIEDSINFVKDIKNRYPQQIRIKITHCPISYSLMIIKKRKCPAIAKVDLYLIKGEADSRHSFIFRSNENMEGYSLYRNNFFDIFNDSESVEIS